MTNARIRYVLAVLLTLLTTSVLAEVSTEQDRTTDFSSYATYAWKKGTPATDPEFQQRSSPHPTLADGPKHGYAMIEDILSVAGVRLGPVTL